MSRKTLLIAIGASASLALAPATAGAQTSTDDTSVSVSGGTLTYDMPFSSSDFDGVAISAVGANTYADLGDYKVRDERGTLAGWKLTVKATQFACDTAVTGNTCTSGDTLPTGRVTFANVTPNLLDLLGNALSGGVTLSTPATAIDGNASEQTIATGTGLNPSVHVDYAADNNGLLLSLPSTVLSNVKAGTYKSTITTTLYNSST